MNSASTVWLQLKEKGLVLGEQPVQQSPASLWYVKTLLAFCGWLAAILIFSFLAAAFHGLLDSNVWCLIFGSLLLVAAMKLLAMPHSDFWEHLALAISFAGQLLIIYTVLKSIGVFQWAVIFLLQVALVFLISNFIHRVYSACFAAVTFIACSVQLNITPVAVSILLFITAWVWLNEFRYSQRLGLMIPIGYGLVLALIAITGSAAFQHGEVWRHSYQATEVWGMLPWIGETLHCMVMLYVVWQLLVKYGVSIRQPLAIFCLAAALLLSLLSIQAQGLTLGIMILLLGFAGSNYVLQALGLTSLLFYLSTYYYLLDISLLEKSKILFLIGMILLAARYVMKRLQVLTNED